jgi:hypothetical protein
MSRIGTDINRSSNALEEKMLPDVEEAKPEYGGVVDLLGDGCHKIYMHRGQVEIYNFGSRRTMIRAARGFGKTSYIGVHMTNVTLGLPRQMGGFCGASSKQLYTRTMPNALKVVNSLGFEQFYFRGQAPAKLHWDMPVARPRNWENIIHFQNGFCWSMISLCVKGSANGLNLAALIGDETKYLPWQRVKEEVLPTLRGDFVPPAARKVEKRQIGRGTDPLLNHNYCSQLWVSDAGLTQKQCEWEKEEQYESKEVNSQIVEMLAELQYLKIHDPQMAVRLAQNENFLLKLEALRSESETFWNFSSVENAAMLGGEAWIRQMKRELPDLMFRIQILGQKKGAARDGFYSNFDNDIHTYEVGEIYDLIADKFTHKRSGKALDSTNWLTEYETEEIDLDQCARAADNCILDVDVDYHEPLRIAIDANANLSCMVVGQTRTYQGRSSLFVLKTFFVLNERKLRALVADFNAYYAPHRKRCGEVIFYFTPTVKQGGATAYAVENSDDSRFDRVVIHELESYGWKVTEAEFAVWRHERKYQFINDCLSFKASPSIYINREAGRNDYLITAIENAAIVPGTFRKDKGREKLKSTDEDSLGGDPRTRTDVTDALDDLIIGVKECAESNKRIGGALRGRFSHIVHCR